AEEESKWNHRYLIAKDLPHQPYVQQMHIERGNRDSEHQQAYRGNSPRPGDETAEEDGSKSDDCRIDEHDVREHALDRLAQRYDLYNAGNVARRGQLDARCSRCHNGRTGK